MAKSILSHVFRARVTTSYTETDLTSSAFGTETPKVLIVHAFKAGGTAQQTTGRNSQSLAIWCDEGTSFANPICHWVHEEHNQGFSDTSNGYPNFFAPANASKLSYWILNSNGTSLSCSGIVTAISGGIKITPDDQGTAIELNVIALGGDGIKSTSLDIVSTGTISSFPYTESLANSSCNPNLLFAVSTMAANIGATGGDDATYSFGIAGMHQGTTLKQYALCSQSESGLNTPRPIGAIFDNAICGNPKSDVSPTQENSLEVSSFGTGEFVLDEVGDGLVASTFSITAVSIELEDPENINLLIDSMTGSEIVKEVRTTTQYLRYGGDAAIVGMIHTSEDGDGSVNSMDEDYGQSILFQKSTTVAGGTWSSGHGFSTSTSDVSAARLDTWGVATVDFGFGTGGDVTHTTALNLDFNGQRQYYGNGLSGPSDKGIFFVALILTRKSTGIYAGGERVQNVMKGRNAVPMVYLGRDIQGE